MRQNGTSVEGKAIDSWYGKRLYDGMCVPKASLEREVALSPYACVVVPGAPNGGRGGGYGVSQLTMKRAKVKSECCFAGVVTVPGENKGICGDRPCLR